MIVTLCRAQSQLMMTSNEGRAVRALCLFSGGLDSQLAAQLLITQGIRLHGLTFTHPFLNTRPAAQAAARLSLPCDTEDISASILRLLERMVQEKQEPGWISVEYHKEMMRRARDRIEASGFDFICSGGVLNQRPPAQTADAFARIDEDTGCGDRVLRPLSAKRLPVTLAERKGWVDRARLGDLEGPSRKAQRELAAQFGLDGFGFAAADGCFTDRIFLRRLRDVCKHEGLSGAKTLHLLRLGRHFRLGPQVKLVLGRNERENAAIEGMTELYDILVKPEDIPGPTGLLPYTASAGEIECAAAICLRYADAGAGRPGRVRVRSPRDARWISVAPASPESIDRLRIDATA